MGHNVRSSLILILVLAVPFDAVTVNPALCPTNKIAPHRRQDRKVQPSFRTFGSFYELLTPNPSRPPNLQLDPLEEQPQEDEPSECGDIEDYDESDLSSLTSQRQERGENRFFLGIFNKPPQHLPSYHPTQATTKRPVTRPQISQNKPSDWSGGIFSNHHYRPPVYQDPSDYHKPVHEAADIQNIPQIYRPGLVGGPLNHVVGVTQVRPTSPTPNLSNNHNRIDYISNFRPHSTQATLYSTRRPRERTLRHDNTVIGSFINLLF